MLDEPTLPMDLPIPDPDHLEGLAALAAHTAAAHRRQAEESDRRHRYWSTVAVVLRLLADDESAQRAAVALAQDGSVGTAEELAAVAWELTAR
ncbi:hypothetical protein SAMN05660359_04761 [Geodermatophilus obscurus]|uniref:Uncharacterized protein n=1 Tax=Geodermatophilus obscurus TaxID=1861 RepID=A0A1I5IPJ3_9ACTN|nr:hypothetical protein [Geodermatophilus obscurus]SFO62249.1 hypothetical protein SAMN05660359_04761 [Geodermatophilus obscurus]